MDTTARRRWAAVVVAGLVASAVAGCSAAETTPGSTPASPATSAPGCFTVTQFNAALHQAGHSSAIPSNSTITCADGYQLASAGYPDGDVMWFAVWTAGGTVHYQMYNYFGGDGCRAAGTLPTPLVDQLCPGGPASPVG
jgi:hypothetical protein